MKKYCDMTEKELLSARSQIDKILTDKFYNFEVDTDEGSKIGHEKRYKVITQQKWRCNECHCHLKWSKEVGEEHSFCENYQTAHIDHIWPYSKRFTYPKGAARINDLDNLQALCQKCNLEKHSKIS